MSFLQPLTSRHLRAAVRLVARCFPTDSGYRWALPVCAQAEALDRLRAAAGLDRARQWIVADEPDFVAATFGLYAMADEFRTGDAFIALNWFCVDPEFRGHGLGRKLWSEIVAAAAGSGARHLVFYSSTEPHHREAEHLYLSAGCERRLGPPVPEDTRHRLTFFNLPLAGAAPAGADEKRRIDESLLRLVAADSDLALATAAEAALAVEPLRIAA